MRNIYAKKIIVLLILIQCLLLCACSVRQKSDLELAQEQYEADLNALEVANDKLKEAQDNLDYINDLLANLD